MAGIFPALVFSLLSLEARLCMFYYYTAPSSASRRWNWYPFALRGRVTLAGNMKRRYVKSGWDANEGASRTSFDPGDLSALLWFKFQLLEHASKQMGEDGLSHSIILYSVKIYCVYVCSNRTKSVVGGERKVLVLAVHPSLKPLFLARCLVRNWFPWPRWRTSPGAKDFSALIRRSVVFLINSPAHFEICQVIFSKRGANGRLHEWRIQRSRSEEYWWVDLYISLIKFARKNEAPGTISKVIKMLFSQVSKRKVSVILSKNRRYQVVIGIPKSPDFPLLIEGRYWRTTIKIALEIR
jgi:hypothetical protein